jgi:hypothetical protein
VAPRHVEQECNPRMFRKLPKVLVGNVELFLPPSVRTPYPLNLWFQFLCSIPGLGSYTMVPAYRKNRGVTFEDWGILAPPGDSLANHPWPHEVQERLLAQACGPKRPNKLIVP